MSYLSESGPFLTMMNLSLERPPNGMRSEPVMNCSSCFFSFSPNSRTICQKFLKNKTKLPVSQFLVHSKAPSFKSPAVHMQRITFAIDHVQDDQLAKHTHSLVRSQVVLSDSAQATWNSFNLQHL